MNALSIVQPGLLSLIQDRGRRGHHRIGLGEGGPLDATAMRLANRLVHNTDYAPALEVSFGGLECVADCETLIAVTGGDHPVTINDRTVASWRSHRLNPGDRLKLGFAATLCRAYVAIVGGLKVDPQFGSCATVVREGIGGLNGDKLRAGDQITLGRATDRTCLQIAEQDRPVYSTSITVRVLPGYQHQAFPRLQLRRFFSSTYTVTDRADRMGYRLQGPAIDCDIEGILSEGICAGAIQIPADGQPIVLLNDRQTIGGYPKIGAALSLDAEKLAQLMPGAEVRFTAIDAFAAHNALTLAEARMQSLQPEAVCHE